MVGVATRAVQTIKTRRRFEDYTSMKQFFKRSGVREVLYNGWQITAGAAAEVLSGERALTRLASESIVYLKSLVDLPAYDGKAIYVEYLDDDGLIKGPITHLLDIADGVGTETEHALGNENVLDTVAACNEDKVTLDMTDYDGSVAGPDDLVGKYLVVYSGEQKGTAHLIASNTVDDPTIITLDAACANVNIAGDLVQIQTYPCTDFFRLRRMWAQKESPEDNAQELCDDDGDVWYGEISDWNSRSALSAYFAPSATLCRSFLGKVHLHGPIVNEGDTVLTGFIFEVTFTPKAIDVNETPSDVTLTFWFSGDFNWEPCIELQPATDVIFKIGDNIAVPHNILVETAILEVLDINQQLT